MSTAGRQGDRSRALTKSCKKCTHPPIGPSITGSSNVLINNRHAIRVTDHGTHSSACDPSAWVAVEGAPTVLINWKNAHRTGDHASHCCGDGQLVDGSPNVVIGNHIGTEAPSHEGGFHVLAEDGTPLADVPYIIRTASGATHTGRTNLHGHTELVFTANAEEIEIEVLNDMPCTS